MSEGPDHEVTSLLQAWSAGDEQALDKLAPLVYHELHRTAHRYMARKMPDTPFKLQHLLTRCTSVWSTSRRSTGRAALTSMPFARE